MKVLIVDDDFTNRLLLQQILVNYGPTRVAKHGKEAIEAIRKAREAEEPYDLICLDIMMPEMDGQEALKAIRAEEEEIGIMVGDGVKVLMISALDDGKNIFQGFREACDGYLVKPIDGPKLIEAICKLGLIENPQ